MKVKVLGCGPSGGVPLVGNIWGKCNPDNPKNCRRRASALISHQGRHVLIDTSPDLRQQLLDANVQRIDAVLYTHDHADHVHGIDELRPLYFGNQKRSIPVYGDQNTIDRLQTRFEYIFAAKKDELRPDLYPPILTPHVLAADPIDICGLRVQGFAQDHGYSNSVGYRINDFAYSTDVVSLDDKAFEALAGVKVWFVDCLSEKPRPTHAHLDLTLSWIERVQPERAILIHMNQELDYDELKSRLPNGVEPAYDGMEIELN